METFKSYHSYLIESLKDPLEAAAYLDAVLEDGDFEHILLALKNVAEAQQNITINSRNNKLNLDLNSQLFPNQQPSELMTIAKLLKHYHNEDFLALNSIGNLSTQILVVCDGVSSSQTPELASQTAAQKTCEFLSNKLTQARKT
ncbi:MAG: hypothetical protein WCQ26_05790 [Pseudanabaena sp. ELA748]